MITQIPNNRIDWTDVARYALLKLEDALAPIVYSHTATPTKDGLSYKSSSGTKMDQLWGNSITLQPSDLEMTTKEFCERIAAKLVAATADLIKTGPDCIPGCVLETTYLDLPGGLLVAERCTDPGKLSVRLTYGGSAGSDCISLELLGGFSEQTLPLSA